MTVAGALSEARARLGRVSETPGLDAQVLLAHVLGKSRAWILAHPEVPLSPVELQEFQKDLSRLENDEPLPYVLGHWEFYGLGLIVTPDTLIPRPETELLVERALAWVEGVRYGREGGLKAIDIGTGAGGIAIALAVHAPGLRLVASDLSLPALKVARRNAARHNAIDRIDFVQADLLTPFPLSPIPFFNLICANLPYIPTAVLQSLDVSHREPRLALDGGEDGLQGMRLLLSQAPGRLAPGGLLLLEIEAGQGKAAADLARWAFPRAVVRVHQDLAGLDRVVEVLTADS